MAWRFWPTKTKSLLHMHVVPLIERLARFTHGIHHPSTVREALEVDDEVRRDAVVRVRAFNPERSPVAKVEGILADEVLHPVVVRLKSGVATGISHRGLAARPGLHSCQLVTWRLVVWRAAVRWQGI